MMRPGIDRYMMDIAIAVAQRSTCLRRSVGCVLSNIEGRILATGYNGVARGAPHCNQPVARVRVPHSILDYTAPNFYAHACEGAELPFGQDTKCAAIHAEANALVWCREPDFVTSAYVTTACCVPCTKLLLGTHCQRIVYLDEHPDENFSKALWEGAGRIWNRLVETK